MTAQPVGVMPLLGALPTTYPDPDIGLQYYKNITKTVLNWCNAVK